jgi:serine/threonine-protein kinase HipA
VADERNVTCGEVLALHLARRAGVDVAAARTEMLGRTPVAVIERFDRTADDRRIPYLSAASLLQASRTEERSYTEIADAIRSHGVQPLEDVRQLWRRMLFNLLIANVDDHLHNLGFLHVEHGLWRLAPAFDLNPFPDKVNESKTWLSPEDGPITNVAELIGRADYFSLGPAEALAILSEVVYALSKWKAVAISPEVGLTAREVKDFAPAFEHAQMREALALLGRQQR